MTSWGSLGWYVPTATSDHERKFALVIEHDVLARQRDLCSRPDDARGLLVEEQRGGNCVDPHFLGVGSVIESDSHEFQGLGHWRLQLCDSNLRVRRSTNRLVDHFATTQARGNKKIERSCDRAPGVGQIRDLNHIGTGAGVGLMNNDAEVEVVLAGEAKRSNPHTRLVAVPASC